MDPILLAERIYKGLTTKGELPNKQALAEDLAALSAWLYNDGFIPYVDPTTGKAPR